MCNFYYFRFMDEYDFHDQILLYLHKFRKDSDFHDLFEHFEHSEYDVIWDRANALYKEGMIEFEIGTMFYSMESPMPIPEKHEHFARITKSGIEYVKNEIIRQLEVETLRKQKIKDDSKRFRVNVIIAIIGLFLVGIQIYQTYMLNEQKEEIKRLIKQRDSLSTVTNDQYNLLKTRDTEIIKMKNSLDSLRLSLKVGQTIK